MSALELVTVDTPARVVTWATDVPAYPRAATSSIMAMRMRWRWEACTSSRLRWWRPRGSGLFQERSIGISEPEPTRRQREIGRSPEDRSEKA